MTKAMNMEALRANLRMIDKKGELALEQARAEGTLTPQMETFSRLLADETFAGQLLAADSTPAVQALLRERGVELSAGEVDAFGQSFARLASRLMENGGELTEEELEQIAGGSIFGGLLRGGAIFGTAGTGAAIGTCICPGIGSCVGVFVGAIGGIALGCEGHERGWYEKAASSITTAAGYTADGMVITYHNAVKGAKKLGKWIKGWF